MRNRVRQIFLLLASLLVFSSVHAQDKDLVIIDQPTPRSPANSGNLNIQGTIVLGVQFLATGKVGKIAIVKALPSSTLGDLAYEAAREIIFVPKLVAGKSVDSFRQIEYSYIPRGRKRTSSHMKDKREALQIAHLLSRRLQKTQDLRGVLDGPVLWDHYREWMLTDSDSSFLFAVNETLIPKLDKKVKMDFVIETGNLFYLLTAFRGKTAPRSDRSDGDLKLPMGVKDILKDDKLFAGMFDSDGSWDVSVSPLTSRRDLLETTRHVTEVNAIFRRLLTSLRSMDHKQYENLLDEGELEGIVYYEPRLINCTAEEKCNGLPEHTIITSMSIPGIPVLYFARIRGQMKIVGTMLTPPD